MAHDVFISHSSKDKLIADAICANLEGARIRCWISSRDIAFGENWHAAITRAISQSRVMVLVFSTNSNSSNQVLKELGLADRYKLLIIPFKIDDVRTEPAIEYLLQGTHWLDAINPPMQEHINSLVERVRAVIQPTAIETTSSAQPTLTPLRPPMPARPVWIGPVIGVAIVLVVTIGILFASQTLFAPASTLVPTAIAIAPIAAPSATAAATATSVPTVIAATNTPVAPASSATSTTRALGPQSEQARTFAEPILTAIAQRKPDFEDDFSKVNPDWGFCDSPGISAIEEGVARFRIDQGDSCMWNDKALTGKDFVLQFDARLVSGDTTSQINIHLHNVTNKHHFVLSLYPAIQAWDIAKQWGTDDFPTLASGTDDAVRPVGETTQIKIIALGSRFALYLNQTPMGFFDDGNFDNAGKTFVHCTSASPAVCEFDNVKFWNLTNISGLR